MKVLVIAPHPDDEVFGVGGTIARLVAEGAEVYVAIVTKGDEAMFTRELIEKGRAEALKAHEYLGVKKTIFMDKFPAALLDTIPRAELNRAFEELMADINPEILFLPFIGDVQLDHRIVFESVMVASRPNGRVVPIRIYAYETLSETNWNAPMLTPAFAPNTFVDISEFIETKIKAIQIYQSQLQPFPNERSVEAVRALAIHRGAMVGCRAAEAFILIRSIYSSSNSLKGLFSRDS